MHTRNVSLTIVSSRKKNKRTLHLFFYITFSTNILFQKYFAVMFLFARRDTDAELFAKEIKDVQTYHAESRIGPNWG